MFSNKTSEYNQKDSCEEEEYKGEGDNHCEAALDDLESLNGDASSTEAEEEQQASQDYENKEEDLLDVDLGKGTDDTINGRILGFNSEPD